MSKTKWLAGVIVLVALGLSLPATRARAQQNNITLDVRGGYVLPVADAHQLWKAGPNFGLGVAYWFNPRIAVRADGEADFLSGKSASDIGTNAGIGGLDVPNMKLYHFGAGLEWLALDPDNTMWRIDLNIGLGGSHLKSGDYPSGLAAPAPPSGTTSFSKTYWSGYGGVRFGYQVHPNVSLSLGGEAHYILTKAEDFVIFGQFNPSGSAIFNDMWTFPIQGQVTFHF